MLLAGNFFSDRRHGYHPLAASRVCIALWIYGGGSNTASPLLNRRSQVAETRSFGVFTTDIVFESCVMCQYEYPYVEQLLVQEGIYLYKHGINPYSGGSFRHVCTTLESRVDN